MEKILLKDYYKPEELLNYDSLTKNHLLNKHENYKGVLVVVRERKLRQFYGMNNKDVLLKSLVYYNDKSKKTEAHWFYIDDIKKTIEIGKAA